jgi:8-oxo-dGTP diphosphatase
MQQSVNQIYGNKLRVRACGILIENEQILMVNHAGIRNGDWWAPPGGGIEFGEETEKALRREFLEEVGLAVTVNDFCFACEYISPPIHAIELFFVVTAVGGGLRVGSDPETGQERVIRDARFISFEELEKLPADSLHGVFAHCRKKGQIASLRGYFKL